MLWGVTSIQNCPSGTIFMHLAFLNFFHTSLVHTYTRARVYVCTRNIRSKGENEGRFEIFILKGVDLSGYIF